MRPLLLFRTNRETLHECHVARRYFTVITTRMLIETRKREKPYHVVIGRYSVLPYYKEMEEDVKHTGLELINSYDQHHYVANMEWVEDLGDLTPKTYFFPQDAVNHQGPLVVKGYTNSKKFSWNDSMYAENFQDALKIYLKLSDDSLIGPQGIAMREYIPLETYEVGVNGIRFTNEWRFFCCYGKIITYGYYWSIAEKTFAKSECPPEAIELVEHVIKVVQDNVNFFVVDVARTEKGNWIVVELNDGQMSGLSEIPSQDLYENLAKVFSPR